MPISSKPPVQGERAADLVYDMQAARGRTRQSDAAGGIWIYPACYTDFSLARRRAHSLSVGFGILFTVDLFGASGPDGDLSPSVGVSEPGYYAFTREDPRPHVLYLSDWRSEQRSARQSGETGETGVEGGGR
jgi:hypothetical protein